MMRIATERRVDGSLELTVDDNGDGTGTVTHWGLDGTVLSTEALTGLPIEPLYPPLDATGALATLLVVEGVLTLTDASLAIHEEESHLTHEAEAWALGNPPA
jgi:hypothetical protein